MLSVAEAKTNKKPTENNNKKKKQNISWPKTLRGGKVFFGLYFYIIICHQGSQGRNLRKKPGGRN